MKKLILLLLFAIVFQPCFSTKKVAPMERAVFPQFGVLVAPAYSTICGGESWGSALGLMFGIEAQALVINKNSSIYTAFLISLQGANYKVIYIPEILGKSAMLEESSYKGKVNLSYISIPILYNYLFENGFYAEAGLQPGILIRAKDKIDGGESYKYKDYVKRFDLGLPVGAGFRFNDKISAGARVVFGLTNINSSHAENGYESDDRDRNFLIMGVARYNFGSLFSK